MALTRFFSAYRIVHRLPGRIRIRIPMLAKLPAEGWSVLDQAAELIRMKGGITSAEIRPITGSLLISYNPDTIDEARILNWLETLVSDFLRLGLPSQPLDEVNIRHRLRQLHDRLCQDGVP